MLDREVYTDSDEINAKIARALRQMRCSIQNMDLSMPVAQRVKSSVEILDSASKKIRRAFIKHGAKKKDSRILKKINKARQSLRGTDVLNMSSTSFSEYAKFVTDNILI